MAKIIFDRDLIKLIALFETMTRSRVKDCIKDDDILIFVVEKGQISRAIGRGGSNIKRLIAVLKKKIKIVEFNEDVCLFVRNLIAPNRVQDVLKEENTVVITDSNNRTKGLIIGRDSKNLRNYKNIVSRYFKIDDIVVK